MARRLGSRQRDVLRAAQQGTSSAWHSGQGRFSVSGVDEVYGDDVLERLLDLGYIDYGDQTVSGYQVVLTEAGADALVDSERCVTCGGKPYPPMPEGNGQVAWTCTKCGDEWYTDDDLTTHPQEREER